MPSPVLVQPAAPARLHAPDKPLLQQEMQDSCFEPRAQLLWSIVGQATSPDWKYAAVSSADPAQPPCVTGVPALLGVTAHTSTSQIQPQSQFLDQDSSTIQASSSRAREESQPSRAPGSACWKELPTELVPLFARAASTPTTALALSGVCRQWREALLTDTATLRSLPIKRLHWRHEDGRSRAARCCLPLPCFACKASQAGNVTASVAAAHALEDLQLPTEALKFWGRAARAGDACSQVVLGKAHYLGEHGAGLDAEEALRWLSRGTRALLTSAPLSCPAAPGRPCPEVVRTGAFMLGLLHLDGEAARADAGEAVKWLRIAARHGSREAPAVLGTLFNTGQYG